MANATPAVVAGSAAATGSNAAGGGSGALGARHANASKLAQFSWALCDASRVPYNVLVNIFVFSAYYTSAVSANGVEGQARWSFITAAGAIIVALTAPVLGAIADAGGRRKPWLAATYVIGVPAMMLLWFATPGMQSGLVFISIAVILGNLFYEYSQIFANAMLPNVAPPERIGFLSGAGLAVGNLSGIVLFCFFLFAWSWNETPLFGLDLAQHEPERAVGILAGIWAVLFCLPLFFFTPDSPGTSRSMGQAVSHGIRSLVETIRKIGNYRNVATFLVARVLFYEGFIVLMLFTGVFASGILKWTSTMLIVQGLANSVAAAIAGFFAGWLDTRIGSRGATIVFVVGCLLANLVLCSVTTDMVFFVHIDPSAAATGGLFPTLPDKVFLVTQCSIAFVVTGGLATGRSLMAKISPQSMLNEFFGLFAMSGTATSFVGPAVIGVLTLVFQSQRVGVAVGLFFLVAGLLVMFKVREEPTPG
ncbi:MAG: MFS transporter [Gammaproteobacteria bacterium]